MVTKGAAGVLTTQKQVPMDAYDETNALRIARYRRTFRRLGLFVGSLALQCILIFALALIYTAYRSSMWTWLGLSCAVLFLELGVQLASVWFIAATEKRAEVQRPHLPTENRVVVLRVPVAAGGRGPGGGQFGRGVTPAPTALPLIVPPGHGVFAAGAEAAALVV